jgi:uncharacterized membrane protein YqjE
VVVSDLLDAIDIYLRRFWRVMAMLADMHMDIARQEASREQQRLVVGMAAIAIGAILVALGSVLLQAAGVLLIHFVFDLSWLASALTVAGLDLLFGAVCLVIGTRKLRGPYMRETRSRLARTTTALTRDDLL